MPGRHRRTSDQIPNIPGQLFDPAGTRNWARVTRDSWSTPQALGPRPESCGAAGRPGGPLDPRPSHPGSLLKPVGPRTWDRVARESWLNPQAVGPGHETFGTADRTHGTSGTGPSRPGPQVELKGLRTRARVILDFWSTPGALTQARDARESCLTPRALGHGPESPGTASRIRGPSGTALSRQGQLVNPGALGP